MSVFTRGWFVSFLLIFVRGESEYCKINCPNNAKHTVCQFNPCSITSRCRNEAFSQPFKEFEKKKIVELHNKIRSDVAVGKLKDRGIPSAADMKPLEYDDELSYIAQCWSNTCPTNELQFNDKCRTTNTFTSVGQIYFQAYVPYTNFNVLEAALNSWYNNYVYLNKTIIGSYTSSDADDFTQLVWSNTTHVGCGRTQFRFYTYITYLMYCNYGSSGNIPNLPVYTQGKPCSGCVAGSCGNIKGLCKTANTNTKLKKLITSKNNQPSPPTSTAPHYNNTKSITIIASFICIFAISFH